MWEAINVGIMYKEAEYDDSYDISRISQAEDC